jgi:2-polyprenyl-6-methoxyphenol hydroxylase-like FAD-dependent oxidoreductase
MQQDETTGEHIVIVGAGPAGLAVSLGLHRYGMHDA